MTVLSSDDPVRVFQRFATVDALSNGRAEVILGRGSFTESFPLFGYDLSDYDVLFEEKIELFVQAARREAGHLERHHRAPRWTTPTCSPRPSPAAWPPGSASAARRSRSSAPRGTGCRSCSRSSAAPPERFAPYVDLYRRAAEQLGTTAHPVGMHSPGFVADTDEEAKEMFCPRYKVMRDRIGALRGWPPMRRAEFDAEVEHGSLYIGSPETVARKIARAVRSARRRPVRPHLHRRRPAGQRPDARRRALRHQGDPDGPRHPGGLTR